MDDEGILKANPSNSDTTCGIGCFKGPWLQKFANYKAYVLLYGLLGCLFSASYSYAGGTITTMEKRFKIPSKTMGVISVGNDISKIFVLTVFSYYIGKGHRPRWLAIGVYTVAIFCFMNAMLYFIYGPGADAVELTYEYSKENATHQSREKQHLCQSEGSMLCETSSATNDWGPLVTLFLAQVISGFGGSLYTTLGVSYMDDNIKKSKTPALFSVAQCLRMFGTVLGYGLASLCLNTYISPSLTPKINSKDPRWVGAFWIGWLVIGAGLCVFASLVGLFPRTMPEAAQRKLLSQKASQQEDPPPSLRDMMETFKRLLSNKVVMCKTLGGVCYVFGYLPFWMYMPKYFEVIFKQSAATANLATGSVGLVCSALGILSSGLVISKFRPQARTLSLWGIIVKVITICGFFVYAYIGCAVNDTQGSVLASGELNTTQPCNVECHCEYVKYNPVCAYGKSFTSPCHAGCKGTELLNGTKVYTDCACVSELDANGEELPKIALPGTCPIDCSRDFKLFLVVVCILKLVGATSQTSNFLISMRSVEERDKAVMMGFGMTFVTVFALVPAPIYYGYVIDSTCLVWGKTCTSKGNCWLYDAEKLRSFIITNASALLGVGLIFAIGGWYYVKDVKLFDEEKKNKKIKFDITEPVKENK